MRKINEFKNSSLKIVTNDIFEGVIYVKGRKTGK